MDSFWFSHAFTKSSAALSSLEEEVNVFNIEDDSSTFLQVDDTYYEEENYDSEVIR